MGIDSSQAKLNIGDSGAYMKWTGAQLVVKNATYQGLLGGAYLNVAYYQLSGSASCRAALGTDGTLQEKRGAGSYTVKGNWYAPITYGVGSSYWVRFTKTAETNSPSISGSSLDTWLALSSFRELIVTRSSAGSCDATFTFEISTSSGGSPIVSSGTFYLYAEYGT
jgi:hypothetical protein